MAGQDTVNLLWNCANALTGETHVEKILKSYYITTSRKLAKHNVQLPEDIFGTARMCSRCGNQWSNGHYNLHLRPQRVTSNPKRLKLIEKLDLAKEKNIKGMITKGQRKRAKWLKKRLATNVVDCLLCKHKTMLPLQKSKTHSKNKMVGADTTPIEPNTPKIQEEKYYKQKGGKAMTSVSLKPDIKLTKLKTKPNNSPQAAAHKVTAKTKQQPNTANAANAKNPKPQSKTQKQNALLLLAAQLKSQSSQDDGKRQQQNRLEAFLR